MERVIFFGSPAFALPSLEALAAGDFRPMLVVTQPDRPAGRGKRLTPTPVREFAERIQIPVRITEDLRSESVLDELRAASPDFCVVVSFGKLLPPKALAVARKGNINLHASLLPRYRGASPINRAIVNGDLFTGVTTMEMTEALDAGPVFLQKIVAIDPMENAGRLSERLAVEGAPLLVETLQRVCGGGLRPFPQPGEGVVKAPLLRKEDGLVPWELDAIGVHNHIRGMNPWPGSYSYYRGAYIKIHEAEPRDLVPRTGIPGLILEAQGDAIIVVCGRGAVRLNTLQVEGKRAHGASEFLRGFPIREGEILGKGINR
jgi:methionyl-tRNA formyltransferase